MDEKSLNELKCKKMKNENCCTETSGEKVDFKSVKYLNKSDSSCCTNDTDCCDTIEKNSDNEACCSTENSDCGCDCESDGSNSTEKLKQETTEQNIKVTIDGKSVKVSDSSQNIVEIAKEAGISIPAPCFLAKRKDGCCNACVVEIDKKQSYACATKPKDGMDIIVNRDDLITLRKERLIHYKKTIENGTPMKCSRS